jgi:hypothetical protein
MSVNQGISSIIATFANRRHADHFVAELKSAGFTDDEIGVISGYSKGEDIEDDAVAGAAATVVVPGVGPLVAGGLLAGIVAGTAAGATTGGVLGVLVGLGISEEKARHHEQELRSGRTLVVVQALGRGGDALDILYRCQKSHGLWLPPTVMNGTKRSALKNLWSGRTSAAGYRTEGESCLAHGEYHMAIADFNEAIHLDPRNAAAYLDRGLAYEDECQWREAIHDYSIAIRLNPENAVAFLCRGNAYFGLEDFDQAISDYSEAIRLDPSLALAYYHRGFAYLEKGAEAEGKADQDKAIRLNPALGKIVNQPNPWGPRPVLRKKVCP